MDQVFSAIRWYFVIQIFGLAALPLCLHLFRYLPDRGYGVSKSVGLLVSGWAFWLLTTFGWTRNTAGGILIALALLAVAGAAIHLADQPTDRGTDQPPERSTSRLLWRTVLVTEALFAVTFVSWCQVRARMPRIQTAGGEKWMEIGFLRAILRSDVFPPHDPWLSGFAISYYYFGYVIVAMITRLAAVPPSIAFNLGIATLFALTCTGAFSLVGNLIVVGGKTGPAPRGFAPRAILGALLGPLFLAVMGNLEGLLEALHARGIGPAILWAWLDICNIDGPPPPLNEGNWIPTRFFWWWQASRVLRDYDPRGTAQEVIDEFPAFSFILGDMHPHLLALPFVLLALALALNLYFRVAASGRRRTMTGESQAGNFQLRIRSLTSAVSSLPFTVGEFLVYAICLGGLGFLNTWDFPIYLFIVAAAYALAHLDATSQPRPFAVHILRFTSVFIPLLVVGILLYLPFWIGFQSQAGGVLINLFNPTRLPQFLVMFGPLVFPAGAFVISQAWRSGVEGRQAVKWTLLVMLCILGVLVLVSSFVVLLVWLGVAPPQGAMVYLAAWLHGEPIPHLEDLPDARTLIVQRLLLRLLSPWTALGLVALLVTIVLLTLRQVKVDERRMPANGHSSSSVEPPTSLAWRSRFAVRNFILLLLAVGALLTLSVEYVFLRDVFLTRMNTVFKFYFQTWVVWAIAAAYIMVDLARSANSIGYVRVGVVTIAVILVVAALVYPVLAIPTRAGEYGGSPTLDGTAYLADAHPEDYAAITWVNENVSGAPVILEAPADSFRAYVYEGRVSALTGLPTLLGWAGHEHQWRGRYDEQALREPDIETLYTSVSPDKVLDLLEKYSISYVYVGPLEKARYPAAGLAKFAGLVDVVYDAGAVTIYLNRATDDLP